MMNASHLLIIFFFIILFVILFVILFKVSVFKILHFIYWFISFSKVWIKTRWKKISIWSIWY